MLRLATRSLALRRLAQNGSASAPGSSIMIQRGFAAQPPKQEEAAIYPPIQVFGIAGKYASALYVSAAKAKALGPVEAEMNQLAELVKTNPGFADFLKDPSVSKPTRVAAIEDIFGQAGFTDISKNFLAVLAEGGRLSYLPKAAAAYAELLRAHRGEVLATVTAAMELTQNEVAEIVEALKGFLKKGESLKLEQKVDRGIIGGLIIDIGENHIDLSIDSKIKQMEKVLAEAL